MPGTQRKGRTRRERANADNLKAQRRQPCKRCGQRIDYSLPPEDPGAFMAGHIKAWILHPELRDDPANLQPEHSRCGKSAGTKDTIELGLTSESW
jgi:hypothetical protein